jgi:hypothetical protein
MILNYIYIYFTLCKFYIVIIYYKYKLLEILYKNHAVESLLALNKDL